MARAATAAAKTSARAQHAPRRASVRPARRRSGPGARAAAATAAGRALAFPQRLELSSLGPAAAGLLDRLLRGRAWVLLIGTLLVGIVFFNVDILRLNRSIATTGEKATALRQENARLLLLRARLGSSERIQQAAAADGMVLPAPGEVRYLRSDPRRDARRAAQRVLPPSPVPPPPATPQTGQTPGTPAPASPTPGTNGTAVPTGTTTTTGVTSPTTPQVSTTTPPSTGAPTTSAPTSVSQQPTGVATP